MMRFTTEFNKEPDRGSLSRSFNAYLGEIMSDHFVRQIEKIKQMVLSLGSAVEHSLGEAMRAVENGDTELSRRIIDGDAEIDRMEIEVEEECLQALAALSAGCFRSSLSGGGTHDQ